LIFLIIPIHENYNPRNGEKLNAEHFSWSEAHLLLLLAEKNYILYSKICVNILYVTNTIMAKSQDAKKNVKKEAQKSAKEKKAEKREKKAKKG